MAQLRFSGFWVRLICLTAAVFSLHCARKRPVERVKDPDSTRWTKEYFVTKEPWLSKVTVVKTSDKGGLGFVGLQSQTYLGFFEFTKDKLNYNSAVKLYSQGSTTEDLINSWNITHTDVHLATSGGRTTNKEVENDEISWDQKRYFRIDWAAANISEATTFPFEFNDGCWAKKSASLVDGSTELSPSYIGFTVAVDYELNNNCLSYERYFTADHTHTLHFKYSFMKADDSSYRPYVYTGESDPLMMKYGYFNTVYEKLGGDYIYKNFFFMNRWDPEDTHTYYFADDFPEEYKTAFNDPETGIFAKTNAMFKKYNIPTRFEIKDNDGSKKFGDIRYSFVKFVSEIDKGAPFGYGPTDTDPRTGEIIAGNLVVWTGYLDFYLHMMTEEGETRETRGTDSSLFNKLKFYLGNNEATWTSTATILDRDNNAGKVFDFLLPEYTFGLPGNGFANFTAEKYFNVLDADRLLKVMRNPSPQIEKAIRNLNQVATERLTAAYRPIVDPRFSTIYELDDPLVSARKLKLAGLSDSDILQKLIYRVSVHEFGHNLNLRHNFYGSVDAKNFKPDVIVNGQSHPNVTASVMDYLQLEDSIYFDYGFEAYDEAALVYAYSDGEVDLTKKNNTTYLYCTDEHTVSNALCNRHDAGTTPSQIAKSLIDRYEDSYWIRNFRGERPYWSTGGYDSAIFSTMFELKKFIKLYEQTFDPSDVTVKMARINALSGSDFAFLASQVQEDIKRSALLAAAFYGAVMQQRYTDRPFNDSFNTWSGALERKGIASDKIFAALFLLGDDAFIYNPNMGTGLTSFLSLSNDASIGTALNTILSENVMEPGDMYLGYNTFARARYAINAVNYWDAAGSQAAIDRLRVACFTRSSFQTKFNIADATAFSNNGGPAHELVNETIVLSTLPLNGNADPYFATGTTKVGVSKINDNFYVSSEQKNAYAYDLIRRGERQELLDTFFIYHTVTSGRVPECQ